jgi:hypothetical protein
LRIDFCCFLSGGAQALSPTQQAVQQVDQYGDFGGSFGQSAATNGAAYPNGGGGGGGDYQRQNSGNTGSAVRSVRPPQTMSSDHYQQPINQVPKCGACQSGIV